VIRAHNHTKVELGASSDYSGLMQTLAGRKTAYPIASDECPSVCTEVPHTFGSWLTEAALKCTRHFDRYRGLNREPARFVLTEAFVTQKRDGAACQGEVPVWCGMPHRQTDRQTDRRTKRLSVVHRCHVIVCSTTHDFVCS
jgi:hypothetical protein